MGNFTEAIKIVQEASANTSSEDKKKFFITLGLIQEKMGKYDLALENFNIAYNEETKESKKTIALHNKALVLANLGRYEEAKECYERELEILRNLGDVYGQAQTFNNLGDLLSDLAQYNEAVEILNKAIKLRERLGDDRGVAHSLGNLAKIFIMSG